MPTRTHLTDADIGVTVQAFGAGGGSLSRSARMGWVFPDNTIDPSTDITSNKWHTLSAMWYELAVDGTLVKRDNSTYGSNFYYTAANALLVRENSTVALVNVSSGNATAVNALTASAANRAAFITEMLSFCDTNNFDGVDLDLETFQVASMSATQYTDFKKFVAELGSALHQEGLILSIEVPPIWNTAANTESGSGDAWDSANSQGYYRLVYSDFNLLPVDMVVIMAYDYQFDYSAGQPNQPLKWLEEILRFARQNINENMVEIVAGIPAAGYSGATGGYSITGRTYDYLSVQTGFSGASRDSSSGELIWANAGTSYAAIDDTAIQLKVAQAEAVGIYKYALWHIGNNQYGGDLTYLHKEPATVELPYTKLPAISDPSAPSDGIIMYAKKVAGRNLPKVIGTSGIDTILQAGLHGNSVAMFAPANATTAPQQWGIVLTTATTISHQQTIASANPWQATRRTRFQCSTTAGNTSGARTAYTQWFRGNAAGYGGFFFRAQIGQNLNLNGGQKFVGLCASTGALAATAGAVGALINMCGMGYDTTDAGTGNWFFLRNDGSDTATKVDLGSNAARNTTHGYDLIMFMAPNSSELFVRIVNLHTGVVVLDTSYTTDLPAVNVGMAFKCEVNNGAVAAANNIEIAKLYIETDY